MIITLTDTDGIMFDVDSNQIQSITYLFNDTTEIVMNTGEIVRCVNDHLTVMNSIVQGYFGG